jgi:hypothetical protein
LKKHYQGFLKRGRSVAMHSFFVRWNAAASVFYVLYSASNRSQ